MSIIKTFVGPKSKYNKSLPFTYEARVKALETDDTVINHFYADTLCALVDYVRISEIEPEEVKLFAVYQKKEIFIDSKSLLDESGKWLKRPLLCRSLEDHYNKTLEEQYQGHKLKEDCAYVDRDKWVFDFNNYCFTHKSLPYSNHSESLYLLIAPALVCWAV